MRRPHTRPGPGGAAARPASLMRARARGCDKLPQPIQTARRHVAEDRDAAATTPPTRTAHNATHVTQRTTVSHATTCRTGSGRRSSRLTSSRDDQHRSVVIRIATFIAGLLLVVPRRPGRRHAGRVTGRVLDQTGGVLPGVSDRSLRQRSRAEHTTTDRGRQRIGSTTCRLVPRSSPYRLLNFSVLDAPSPSPAATGDGATSC